MQPFCAATYVHVFVVWNFTRLITRLESFFLTQFGGGHSAPIYIYYLCRILISRLPRVFRRFKRRSCLPAGFKYVSLNMQFLFIMIYIDLCDKCDRLIHVYETIVWINDDLIYWCIYASLSINELMMSYGQNIYRKLLIAREARRRHFWLYSHLCVCWWPSTIDSSPPGQNGCHFTDNVYICIFMNETFCILIEISLNCVPKGPMDNNAAFV